MSNKALTGKQAKKLRPFAKRYVRDEDCIPLGFDTETDGLGGKLLFATAHDMDKAHEFEGEPEKIISDLIGVMIQYPAPFVWFAHNAQYDWRYFIDYIVENDIPVEISMRTETDIYQITLWPRTSGRVVMRDFYAMYPGTLRDFASKFAPELPKGDIDFEKETFDPSNPEHRAYARRDVQILKYGIPRFNAQLSRHFGVDMGHTTAGTALKAWQATLGDDEFYDVSVWGEDEEFIRDGYYGGLVFLTTTEEKQNAITFDINSSYPDKMDRYGVPYGGRIKTRDILPDQPGIYRVKVRTPEGLQIPILPCRNAKGAMRWRVGEFITTVTNVEIEFAQQHGYEILECYGGIAWESMVFPFAKIISMCKEMRKQYKGMAEETLAKLMQNSLYGKFASRRLRSKVFRPESDEETIGAETLDDNGYFWVKQEFSEDMRVIPEWSVFITAHARLHLLGQIYKCGPENVYYGDTDSLTVCMGVAHMFDVGNEYGQWKPEKEWIKFRATAPKIYAGQLKKENKWTGAAKGLPKKKMTPTDWEGLANGLRIKVEYDSLASLKTTLEKGAKPARKTSRLSGTVDNSDNWVKVGSLIFPKEFTQ